MAGIGLTLLPVYYRWSNFAPTCSGSAPLPERSGSVRLAGGGLGAGHRASARCGLGVAPHSLRAVTPEDLKYAAQLLPAAPIHIHAAEQEREVADCLVWSGRRPVEWLLDEMEIGPRWCIVHATHIAGDEIWRLANSGAVVALCPLTEANLGDGICPATAYAVQWAVRHRDGLEYPYRCGW